MLSTLNLCGVFNQFLIGINWTKFYLALQFRSNVFKLAAGLEIPINLYIKAVPSGMGKNKDASCDYIFIWGTYSFLVIVNGL